MKGVAIVTGGARRVGRAVVLALSDAGYTVVIHYNESAAEAAQLVQEVENSGRKAASVHGDLSLPVTWPTLIGETVDRFGRLDVLVNNASMFQTDQPDTLEAFDAQRWESMLGVNLLAAAGLCRAAQPYLVSSGAGCIVNVCDVLGLRPSPNHLGYCASKAGLIALTRGLARALAPSVRVNAVAPGVAIFPEGTSEKTQARLIGQVPAGRAGTPGEVASLIRFLVESASYVTGQVIAIDGGRSLV